MVKSEHSWTFLTSHAQVLLVLHRDPNLLQRQIADEIGITEGRVHGILSDLQHHGYICVQRRGRRNHYVVDASELLRYLGEIGLAVDNLLVSTATTSLSAGEQDAA